MHAQQQQLGNLSHLFDDLDKASSDMSECPDTPLQLFPVTPTSNLLMQNHFNQGLPEAPTPPLVSTVLSPGLHAALFVHLVWNMLACVPAASRACLG